MVLFGVLSSGTIFAIITLEYRFDVSIRLVERVFGFVR